MRLGGKMKIVWMTALCLTLSTPAFAVDFCKHEDAAEVLEQFFFSTEPGTRDLLGFISAENARHGEIEAKTQKLAQGGKSADAVALYEQVKAKRAMSLHIEEELRCRLGDQG
jgi:hypothetical protein